MRIDIYAIVVARRERSLCKFALKRREEHVVSQRRLTRARHSSDTCKHSERNLYIYVFQVIMSCTSHPNNTRMGASACGCLYHLAACEIVSSKRVLCLIDIGSRTTIDHLATANTSLWAYVDNPIRSTHNLLLMLYDNNRVIQVAQLL